MGGEVREREGGRGKEREERERGREEREREEGERETDRQRLSHSPGCSVSYSCLCAARPWTRLHSRQTPSAACPPGGTECPGTSPSQPASPSDCGPSDPKTERGREGERERERGREGEIRREKREKRGREGEKREGEKRGMGGRERERREEREG